VKSPTARRVVERLARADVRARFSRRRSPDLGLDEGDLTRALTSDELLLHYQPIVDVRGGACRRLEALLRWQHPRLGQILPGDFLHLATSPELQDAITQWVIRAALDQVTKWNEQGERLGISINLSRHDVTHVEKIVSAVRGTRTGAVTFELRPGDLGSDDLRLAAVRL
jgi:EAL domain-containing protein (putative c-di-GMP-specific phosphodiesterase class I)